MQALQFTDKAHVLVAWFFESKIDKSRWMLVVFRDVDSGERLRLWYYAAHPLGEDVSHDLIADSSKSSDVVLEETAVMVRRIAATQGVAPAGIERAEVNGGPSAYLDAIRDRGWFKLAQLVPLAPKGVAQA